MVIRNTLAALLGGLGIAGISAASLSACNAVLGIDEALVDRSTDASTQQEAGLEIECNAYCSKVLKNCTGVNAEYTNMNVCLSFCRHFDVGRPGDESGNSLACRVFHAAATDRDPNTHCRHAGPLGGTHCGDVCSSFCLLTFAVCSSRPPYASEAECRALCPTFPYIATPDAGDLFEEDGTSVNCRLWHLQSAVSAPETHCSHTSLSNVHCTPPKAHDAGTD